MVFFYQTSNKFFCVELQERQEARMQVIAADLDQAQQVADFLQKMLDDRENQLHTELYQTDMNNQMISRFDF